MSGGAAIAQSRAEADKHAGDGDKGEACGHLRGRKRPSEQPGGERGDDQPDDKGGAPEAIVGGRVDQPGKNAGDARNAAIESHQKNRGEPNQCAPDSSGNRCEIAHGVASKSKRHRPDLAVAATRSTISRRRVAATGVLDATKPRHDEAFAAPPKCEIIVLRRALTPGGPSGDQNLLNGSRLAREG